MTRSRPDAGAFAAPAAVSLVDETSTLPDLLAHRVAASPEATAFLMLGHDQKWSPVSWREYASVVRVLATAIEAKGLRHGDRIGILAATCIEWEHAQAASLRIGAVVFGFDVNYSDELLGRLLMSTRLDAVFAGDAALAARIPSAVRAQLKLLVVFDSADGATEGEAVTLASLLASTAAPDGTEIPRTPPRATDFAIGVFSSGTTGIPKAVLYTHEQVLLAVRAILGAFPDLDEGCHLLCWLPLANLFQRIINFCSTARGARSYVLADPRQVIAQISVVNPHLLIGVPRFFEKLRAGIEERMSTGTPWQARAARWAVSAAKAHAETRRAGKTPALSTRLSASIADRLVVRKVRSVFGANLRYLISGSAPMSIWDLEWYAAIGLPVLEAYGISEDIVPIALNRPDARRLGTVGRPMPPNEVEIAADGEIAVRGPGVFAGYLEAGDDGAARKPDARGFWLTGDYGSFDQDGFLRITGRRSEAFKTSGGRWIAPGRIEAALRRAPYVEHAVVLGAGRRHVVALLAVDNGALRKRANALSSGSHDKRAATAEALTRNAVRDDLLEALAGFATYERPQGVLVSTSQFSMAGGELTTNLKLRRQSIEGKYGRHIDALCAAADDARDHGAPRPSGEPPQIVIRFL